MLYSFFPNLESAVLVGGLATFALVCILLTRCVCFLPQDMGRQYAHDGQLSAGKPRGAGILFIIAFVVCVLLFLPFAAENAIYLLLLVAAMMTGYLDDGSRTPWNEYIKGLLDLAVAILIAVTFLNFNSPEIRVPFVSQPILLPPLLYGVLAVILVWASINVTNCTDGVDGLSGSLGLTTLGTLFVFGISRGTAQSFQAMILLFCSCILAYQWFNAHPSKLMMGDAGSRAMGMFIALAAMKTGSPLIWLLAAAVIILDGGLGLIKVALLRFLKIHILKNTRTPLHDHVRKNAGWSDTQTVFRFVCIQVLCGAITVYLGLMS